MNTTEHSTAHPRWMMHVAPGAPGGEGEARATTVEIQKFKKGPLLCVRVVIHTPAGKMHLSACVDEKLAATAFRLAKAAQQRWNAHLKAKFTELMAQSSAPPAQTSGDGTLTGAMGPNMMAHLMNMRAFDPHAAARVKVMDRVQPRMMVGRGLGGHGGDLQHRHHGHHHVATAGVVDDLLSALEASMRAQEHAAVHGLDSRHHHHHGSHGGDLQHRLHGHHHVSTGAGYDVAVGDLFGDIGKALSAPVQALSQAFTAPVAMVENAIEHMGPFGTHRAPGGRVMPPPAHRSTPPPAHRGTPSPAYEGAALRRLPLDARTFIVAFKAASGDAKSAAVLNKYRGIAAYAPYVAHAERVLRLPPAAALATFMRWQNQGAPGAVIGKVIEHVARSTQHPVAVQWYQLVHRQGQPQAIAPMREGMAAAAAPTTEGRPFAAMSSADLSTLGGRTLATLRAMSPAAEGYRSAYEALGKINHELALRTMPNAPTREGMSVGAAPTAEGGRRPLGHLSDLDLLRHRVQILGQMRTARGGGLAALRNYFDHIHHELRRRHAGGRAMPPPALPPVGPRATPPVLEGAFRGPSIGAFCGAAYETLARKLPEDPIVLASARASRPRTIAADPTHDAASMAVARLILDKLDRQHAQMPLGQGPMISALVHRVLDGLRLYQLAQHSDPHRAMLATILARQGAPAARMRAAIALGKKLRERGSISIPC